MRLIPFWLILLLCGCLVPDPIPVTPDDGQTPVPVVPSVEGPLKVLILYEADTAEFQKLPASQILAIQSLKLRNFLQAKGADWRIWDQHVNTDSEPQFWQDAVKLPHNSLPWIWVAKGSAGVNGALPKTEAEIEALIEKVSK